MIKRIQLEINGTCPRSCPECLPASLKTGVKLGLGDVSMLALDWKDVGIEAITLAGYGSSVDHPDFAGILGCFHRYGFRVSVVCRPGEIVRCLDADQIVVSVQTLADVEQLRFVMSRLGVSLRLSTHTIVSPKLHEELSEMLMKLSLDPQITRVNVADAIVLCNDPAHVKAIRECAKHRQEILGIIEKARREQPCGDKITQQLQGHFPEKCAFHDDLIYVNADLKVSLCCHHPTLGALGNLRTETWAEAMNTVGLFQANWRKHPACLRCPDVGGES